MKRIKILYLIDEINIGGTEKQLLALIGRLDHCRFEPYLVCLRSSALLEQCDLDCHKKALNVVSLASMDGFKKLCYFVRYLRAQKIDIVQTFFFDSTLFGVLAARLAGVRKVLSSRRDMGFWYTPRILKVLFFVNLLTDRIVVNSEAIKEVVQLRERAPVRKIDVLYNGVDLVPFQVKYDDAGLRKELKIPASDYVVGIVANLNRHVKRVDLFVEAAAEVLKEIKNVSFVVVGEGHFRQQFEAQACSLRLGAKIHFVGSKKNIIPYLQLLDVGVLTSESEGFSNAIIEYMAAGLPVVCHGAGGNCELIKQGVNGSLFKDHNGKSVSEEILSLLRNKALCRAISRCNLELVGKLEWIKTVENYQSYNSALMG